tara:strand:+ start:3315 stop:4874 length:1560 start_codon:yes stop_codon:yes gene_type:complete
MKTMLRYCAALGLLLIGSFVQANYLETQNLFSETPPAEADTVVVLVPLFTDGTPAVPATWPEETAAQFQRAIDAQAFTGALGEQFQVLAPAGIDAKRLIALGVGDGATLQRADAESVGAALALHLATQPSSIVAVNTALLPQDASHSAMVAAVAHGADLANYRFDRYKSAPESRPAQTYHWLVPDPKATEARYTQLRALAEGVFTARELTNLPGSDGYPAAFVDHVRQRLEPLGIKITVLTPKQILQEGMEALYGVSRGSQHGSHLLIAQWRGSKEAPIALVGKGITFDTGGYNLKLDAESLLAMTGDKAGAAAVAGTLEALARQRAPVNVVGIMPLSQNAVSGTAQLPGDVVKSGSGITIEIANTDAEGRLVLADGIWYAREKFKPRVIADIATLTGSKVRALGRDYAAVFSTDDALVDSVAQAGELTRERVWRLPLGPYEKIIESTVADIRNTGTPGAQAGAVFLQQFAGDTPWVHIDMAGNGRYDATSKPPLTGATGYGVRLLTEWVTLYANTITE